MWRPRPESNRRTRICNPLHGHSATRPFSAYGFGFQKKPYPQVASLLGAFVPNAEALLTRPPLPKGCVFIREGVAAKTDPESKLDTVLSHLRRYRLASRRDVILKMDIEGGEWDIIAALPDKALDAFEQIVVEFHWLENLKRDSFSAQVRAALQRLNERFTLCHVHANVYGGLRRPAGVVLPNVLEATYVRSDLISRTPNKTFYPTEHDRTNRPGSKDIVLSMYPFVPMVVPPQSCAPNKKHAGGKVIKSHPARATKSPAQA